MAKIIDLIHEHQSSEPDRPFFSFEFFPPKTDIGVVNLYERIERMGRFNPFWIDVTWGAGGSTAEKTLEICQVALKYYSMNVMMHLTCTNITKESIRDALLKCKAYGIRNILALRGDPPANAEGGEWKAVEGGFAHAVDLVKYIRAEFGDYFCVAVAGYPEGHLEATSFEDDLLYLKEKLDAGADMVVTQLFYDVGEFANFVRKLKALGVDTDAKPILPGIMPIQSYAGFCKMTTFCKTKVPQEIFDRLEPIKDDEQLVKAYGVEQAIQMCTELLTNSEMKIRGLHFYTLNLETSVLRIVQNMELFDSWRNNRRLPFQTLPHVNSNKSSSGEGSTASSTASTTGSTPPPSVGGAGGAAGGGGSSIRGDEQVRPVFWANRPQSYIHRTASWDDFPNGRFGNKDSPAYGDFTSAFVSYSKESLQKLREDRRKMWGKELTTGKDVSAVFVKFLQNEDGVKKLPWNSEAPTKETNFILPQLCKLNKLEVFTINSQPRVNGSLSNDPYVGWGPSGGFVYQKGYVEFFISPDNLRYLLSKIEEEKLKSWRYTALNKKGERFSNNDPKSICAITWGVFPGSEVIQPTVCDDVSFSAWKEEAFTLWDEWADIYPQGSTSQEVIRDIQNNYFLVNIVDNDFVAGDLLSTLVELLDANAKKAWRAN
mmetsp:Transcript_18077/g.45303  ORF Transcript_18077/g.45303 Transcript_18077/m.45303 type:complete len:656 (+) Transcript_18077:205-2172(+)|eukprot:CAMPEP_0178998832 /NCGR_PEP_ID=MMETSP0795-20121207/9720_1 /TAXON_ID=88552 /ORGANISM="Amoebophrya sp., Strain Ameob2" /LENGTH=655 /DNA_ID=CAMNT_0020691531 /DNA_START=144 /DNA_END=2111 /DNA_ORIENTATION=+